MAFAVAGKVDVSFCETIIRPSADLRIAAIPETKTTLLRVLAKSLRGAFASPIIPRLFLVLFRGAQPLIIQQSVRYVDNRTDENLCARYDLMLIATIAYIGLAVRQTPFVCETF